MNFTLFDVYLLTTFSLLSFMLRAASEVATRTEFVNNTYCYNGTYCFIVPFSLAIDSILSSNGQLYV